MAREEATFKVGDVVRVRRKGPHLGWVGEVAATGRHGDERMYLVQRTDGACERFDADGLEPATTWQPEPPPSPCREDLPEVADLVVEDVKARKAMGVEKYGTPLQPFNGRNPLKDAYEEVLDLANYLRQAMLEAPPAEVPPCSVCAGEGVPLSGHPCVCSGTGRQDEEVVGLRMLLHEAQAQRTKTQDFAIRTMQEKDAALARLREAALHAVRSLGGHDLHMAIEALSDALDEDEDEDGNGGGG